MGWKPYILFPNEAQDWLTAPSYGYLRVAATSPSRTAPREPAGDAGPGQRRQELMTWTTANLKGGNKIPESVKWWRKYPDL